MAILLIFTTYLYAMLYGEPEHAARIKYLDDKINHFTSPFLHANHWKCVLFLFIVIHYHASLVDRYLNELTK